MREVNAMPGLEIHLGRVGENMAVCVVLDVTDWRQTYGDGSVQLLHKRNGDQYPYPCAIEVDGGRVCWPVTASDVAVAGKGWAELQYLVGEVCVKSETFATRVERALGNAGPTPPEPHEGWVQQVLEAGAQVEVSAEETADAAARAQEHAESVAELREVLLNSLVVIDDAVAGTAEDRQAVEEDRAAIEAMTVTSETLEPGEDATVEKRKQDGVMTLHFGIPTGDSGVYVGTTKPTDPNVRVWINPNGKANDNPGGGGGLTQEQVNALDGLFQIAAYKEDARAAYAAFRSAFGLADDPVVPDEPVVTTYTVTNNLTDVTNSNGNTTASGFYSGHLGAAEGYNIVVTITMGGVDVTESVYTEDGTILITEVTGDIVITATAELAGAPVLYQLANTPVTCNADLYEDTGLTFGSGTANGYTKAWTMVMKVSNMTAGNLWCVNGNNGLRSNYEKRWNGAAGNNTAHLNTSICATVTRPSITQKEPNSICVVITKEAMSQKTATVHYLNYAGELQSEELVGTYGQLNGSVYAGNMMVGGQTAADFVGTIEEFTIYEGVATEDQVKAYLGVA